MGSIWSGQARRWWHHIRIDFALSLVDRTLERIGGSQRKESGRACFCLYTTVSWVRHSNRLDETFESTRSNTHPSDETSLLHLRMARSRPDAHAGHFLRSTNIMVTQQFIAMTHCIRRWSWPLHTLFEIVIATSIGEACSRHVPCTAILFRTFSAVVHYILAMPSLMAGHPIARYVIR